MPTEPAALTLEERVSKLEASPPGFWAGLDSFIAGHPKLMMMASALLTAAITWGSTYFSIPPTRDVHIPGPEKVIEKTVIREAPTGSVPAPANPKGSIKAGEGPPP